jgi:hypothetical protein
MQSIRRSLRLWMAIWLVVQVASLSALVPRDCCAAHSSAARAAKPGCHEQVTATQCPMHATDGTPCPMHRGGHGEASQKTPDGCAMRGTCSGPMAALVAQLSNYGVLPATPQVLPDLHRGAVSVDSDEYLLTRLASPDPPPPRA